MTLSIVLKASFLSLKRLASFYFIGNWMKISMANNNCSTGGTNWLHLYLCAQFILKRKIIMSMFLKEILLFLKKRYFVNKNGIIIWNLIFWTKFNYNLTKAYNYKFYSMINLYYFTLSLMLWPCTEYDKDHYWNANRYQISID